MPMHRALLAVLMGLAAMPALACGPDSDCMVGERTYRIALPEGASEGLPAIVFAHGYRGTAQGVMNNASLRQVAAELGAALIAVKSGDEDWVIPNAPRHMETDGAEEFAYFDAVLEDAAARFGIDRTRVMATGFSAGGMMVWNLACARSGSFAGFAPISGTFWLEPPESCDRPVASLIHIHGDDDPTVPLEGRPIGPTQQGRVDEALEMYANFGDFGAPDPAAYDGLGCQERRNGQGDLLAFCLFEGGHSFRTEFVRFAWETFREMGRL